MFYILNTKKTTHTKVFSPSDTDCFYDTKPWGVGGRYKCSRESGQPDDPVLFPQAQRSRWLLLLLWLLFNFPLHFFLRVPQVRVGLVLPCLATLSALRTLSVVWIHILLHTLSRVFQRGATDQATVLHSWVQTQPVHHVVDTAWGGCIALHWVN